MYPRLGPVGLLTIWSKKFVSAATGSPSASFWASLALSRRFSSARRSLSCAMLLKISLRRRTSSSRALMYSSFRSRCVLHGRSACIWTLMNICNSIPLCLSIQLLTSCKCWLAIRLGAPFLWWLTIYISKRRLVGSISANSGPVGTVTHLSFSCLQDS